VSGKHRKAYARAASLAYAHAETLATIGRESDAPAPTGNRTLRYQFA
jgi:hypothetical protein